MQFDLTHIQCDENNHILRLHPVVKLLMMLIYSVGLFFVDTWAGLSISFAVIVLLCIVGHIRPASLLRPLIPILIILFLSLIFNGFSFAENPQLNFQSNLAYMAGTSQLEPIVIVGSLKLVPAGITHALFYAFRILLVMLASFIFVMTSPSSDLLTGLVSSLSFLRRFRLPVDELVMVISIALRFIPLTARQMSLLLAAQKSRLAPLDEGGVLMRIKAHMAIMIPLFIAMFRQAETLALAMDARGFGLCEQRSSLHPHHLSNQDLTVLLLFLVFMVFLVWLF